MKQALLMNPDSMKDLLNGSSQQTLGTSHSSFTSRRDWQAVTVSTQLACTCQNCLHTVDRDQALHCHWHGHYLVCITT